MRTRDLKQLEALAEMVFQADLARLRQNADAVRAVEAQAEAHREARAARARVVAGFETPDPAALASADARWSGWTDRELTRIQGERARLAVEAEIARAAARRSFGRGQALDRLAAMLAEERRQTNARKALHD